MTTDIAALWAERQAADAARNPALEDDVDPAWAAWCRADEAIRQARPMTIVGLAIQARTLEDSLAIGQLEDDVDLARAIAMTRATLLALALLLAFLLGVVAGVLVVPWLATEQVVEEQRFTVDPAWWPKPPRCPPFSTVVEPTTRPL